MNAFTLYQSAFDSYCDFIEFTTDYVVAYASGAFDKFISVEVAKKIVDCAINFRDNGNGSNDLFYMIEQPLSAIEL
jgi:hypothetical protein